MLSLDSHFLANFPQTNLRFYVICQKPTEWTDDYVDAMMDKHNKRVCGRGRGRGHSNVYSSLVQFRLRNTIYDSMSLQIEFSLENNVQHEHLNLGNFVAFFDHCRPRLPLSIWPKEFLIMLNAFRTRWLQSRAERDGAYIEHKCA